MMYNNVNISKADNGFVVSCYDGKEEKKAIAESMEGALYLVKKMLDKEAKKENYKEIKEKADKMAMVK